MNNTELLETIERLEASIDYLVKNKKVTAEYREGFLVAIENVKEAIQ